ncbi:hypothetical protein SGI36_11190 [Providencia rettgeri]|uniref:hypothetical protein n=1 Tax=Providencia TaxID=586 RepID=UPI001B38C894|nr:MULTISPECIES: hypothetical protein [Providencia]MBQ0532032.1 hypothetical protein [Providencia rettgeri]WOB85735.1 hypothetical protein P3L40_19235 [Providencia sp. PROV040]
MTLSNGDSCHQRLSAIALFHGFDQTGQYLLVNESIDDFSTYNFDNKIMSLDIPDGWAMRFFKKTFRVTIIPALQEREMQIIFHTALAQ